MSKNFYIDTHCHLFESEFNLDTEEVIDKIKKAGVQYSLLANTDIHSIEKIINFEKKYKNICKSMIGIHPNNVVENYKSQIQIIEKYLSEHHFIGIGEIGLDYYESTQNHDIQKKFLIEELFIARENNLPISMHVRNAFDDSLKILKDCQNGNLNGVIHCFTGNIEQAKKCLDLGFSLGIGGIVTFKNSFLPEVLKHVPIEKIVLETDSPCLTPVPFRGKRNDSSFLPLIVDKIAEIYNSSHELIAKITTANAKNIFKLK